MLRRFGPNEVIRIATDSIYIRREVLYKIENVSAFFKQAKHSLNHRFRDDLPQSLDKGAVSFNVHIKFLLVQCVEQEAIIQKKQSKNSSKK